MILLDNPLWGPRLGLRSLLLRDVGSTYLSWLKDPEIVRYTEARHEDASLESLYEYIQAISSKEDEHLFGIFQRVDGRHVGNIKLGPIHPRHRSASLGLIIGEKAFWGRGYASEAIGLTVRVAFEMLNLNKLTAGVISDNIASIKAFKNNLFIVEGVRRKQNYCAGHYQDVVLLGLLAEEWPNG